MSEGQFTYHNMAKAEIMRADIDFAVNDIRIMLLNGWTPDIDNDDYWDDISTYEIVASGYTANGESIGTPVVSVDDTNNLAKFDGVDVTWTSLATTTITRAALVNWTGTASTSHVIGSWEIETNSNGDDYVLRFNVNGILRFV